MVEKQVYIRAPISSLTGKNCHRAAHPSNVAPTDEADSLAASIRVFSCFIFRIRVDLAVPSMHLVNSASVN